MTTGRPSYQFTWAQVEKLEKGKWKCIHCGIVHTGGSTRIRNHLLGLQRKGITACEKASEAIKNGVLREVRGKKREGGGSHSAVSSMITTSTSTTVARLQDPSSINDDIADHYNERMNEERMTDEFVKLRMCQNAPLEDIKEPSFRKLLEGLGRCGVPSRLLGVDSSLALEKSVVRIKQGLERDMVDVKVSWKTTGCTAMVFELNNHHGKGERSEKDRTVIALYSPKGIHFVAASPELDDCACRIDYVHDLERDRLRSDAEKRVHWLRHSCDSICELNRKAHSQRDPVCRHGVVLDEYKFCLRSEIHKILGGKFWWLVLSWVNNLVNKAVEIHNHLCVHGDPWYRGILTAKNVSLDELFFEKEASRLPVFLLIMQQDPEKKSNHHRMKQADIEEITNGTEFWSDGRQLALILSCVYKFVDVMDTLVPTSGYFDMAFDKVKNIIESCRLQLEGNASKFWEELKSKIEDIANTKIFSSGSCRLASSYLNPVYFLQQLQKDSQLPVDQLKAALKDLAERQQADPKDIDEEVERYSKVFSSLSERIPLVDRQPGKLWDEYGHDLPVLRTWALKLLNRPLSCLCKQVKEHIYHLQGSEYYITTLNFRMMRHFQDLGDDIYKPLDLSQLDQENLLDSENYYKMFIANNEPSDINLLPIEFSLEYYDSIWSF